MVAATTDKPGEIPTVRIEGDLVKHYNVAAAQVEAGERLMKDLRPEILEIGLAEVFKRSCANPASPTPTVKLQDEQDDVLRVQFTARYGKVQDTDAVEDLCDSTKGPDGKPVDINRFLQETVSAKFNCAVFNGADGKFSQRIYDKFRNALERVAAELDVPCPLETEKVVIPLTTFHDERFTLFPDPAAQLLLAKLCPNTNSIVPVTRKAASA